MRLPVLVLTLLSLSFLPAVAGHKPPQIVLRVFIQTNTGLPESEARTVQIPPDNEEIAVRTLPEVTEDELTAVQTDAAGGVHLQFNHTGQVDLDACTAQNQGRIMLVTIDGVIVYAPTIDMQITTGELIIPHALEAAIIQRLKAKAADNNEHTRRT